MLKVKSEIMFKREQLKLKNQKSKKNKLNNLKAMLKINLRYLMKYNL